MKKHIPNLITALNLLAGCFAIVLAFEGSLLWAAYSIVVAMVFDFFDGLSARWLKASSALGEQLDSLADMVSFGVAPGIILYCFSQELNILSPSNFLANNHWPFYLAFAIPIFSAFRLANFNIDTRQKENFIGLPTPANACFFVFSVILFYVNQPIALIDGKKLLYPILSNPMLMLFLGVLFSVLLVVELPMFSLKFKTLKWQDNKERYLFLGVSSLLIIMINIAAIPIIIVGYVLWSLLSMFLFSKR